MIKCKKGEHTEIVETCNNGSYAMFPVIVKNKIHHLRGKEARQYFEMGRAEVIEKELNAQCLNCGKGLLTEILQNKIHVHLCKSCRQAYIDKLKEAKS